MSHHCHARGCKVEVKPELLMCSRHWKMVPSGIQQAVYRYYRPGQCGDKQPSEDWHKAADGAIGAVARLEGKPLRLSEEAALAEYAKFTRSQPSIWGDPPNFTEEGPKPTAASGYDPRAHGAFCHVCPLKGQDVVPPARATGRLRLIIVEEGPGRVEERLKIPFVGPAGKFLDTFLEAGGIDRSEIHITNAMNCRGESDADNNAAEVCCAPRLLRELAGLDPKVPIVALGKSAAKSILGVRSIFLARGFVWTAKSIDLSAVRALRAAYEKTTGKYKLRGKPVRGKKSTPMAQARAKLKWKILRWRRALAGRTVLPTLHPAFVLRADAWKPLLEIDFKRIFRLLGRLEQGKRLKLHDTGPYEHVRTARAFREAALRLGPVIAADIETDGIEPLTTKMLCLGLSDGKHTVVVDPRRKTGDDPVWSEHLIRLISIILRSRTTVFHNGYNFDQIVMKQHGIEFLGKLEDTLLAYHAFASHFPMKLDQVVSTYVDSAPWKHRFGRRGAEEKAGLAPKNMDRAELALYNSGDARLTILSWLAMRGDLEPEYRVYEHDKRLSEICQQMHFDGIGFDAERKEYLSKRMIVRARALRLAMRKLTGRADFSPARLNDVRWALFKKFRAPILAPTKSGITSTSAATLEALAQANTRAGRMSRLLLKWRVIMKVRGTYLEAIVPGADGRIHYNWRPYGTVSGRWSCRLQSIPRGDYMKGKTPKPERELDLDARARELYIP